MYTVYNVRNQPEDPVLKKHANTICPGSSDDNDNQALDAIRTRCRELMQ